MAIPRVQANGGEAIIADLRAVLERLLAETWAQFQASPPDLQLIAIGVVLVVLFGPGFIWWNNIRANRLARQRDEELRQSEERVRTLAQERLAARETGPEAGAG